MCTQFTSHLFKVGGRACKKKRQVPNKLVYTLYTEIPHNGNCVNLFDVVVVGKVLLIHGLEFEKLEKLDDVANY